LTPSRQADALQTCTAHATVWLRLRCRTGRVQSAPPWAGTYDVADADGSLGRADNIDACLRRLDADGVLAVVGPSGSGKSSLVRAGAAARLQRDGRRVVVVTPGARPMG
jgi:hypothetical protein